MIAMAGSVSITEQPATTAHLFIKSGQNLMASVWVMPASLVDWINPTLAFMLYVTFLQVPVSQLGKALTQLRFLAVLLVANFCLIPLFVFALLPLLPQMPSRQLPLLPLLT